jgi:DNA-binding transcriptional LysR family regulator
VLSRQAVTPRLPELLQLHPLLELELSSTGRRVDLVREGFDCVLRAGPVVDASLIGRPLGHMRMINFASPAYLLANGTPLTLADLTQPTTNPNTPPYQLVHYASTLGTKPDGFDYAVDGKSITLPMPGAITVNNADAYAAACLAGLGIIQAPAVALKSLIDSGQLVAFLPDYTAQAMPLHLLYANRRNLSKRMRVVMDWLASVVGDHLQEK